MVVEENELYAFGEVDLHHPMKDAISDTWWTSQYAAEMRARRTGLGRPGCVGRWAKPSHRALGQLPARHCSAFSIFLNFVFDLNF
jgi:hypothetical protein